MVDGKLTAREAINLLKSRSVDEVYCYVVVTKDDGVGVKIDKKLAISVFVPMPVDTIVRVQVVDRVMWIG